MMRKDLETELPPELSLLKVSGVFGPHNPQLCRVIARLLSYPEQGWLDELPTVRELVSELAAPAAGDKAQFLAFIDHLRGQSCGQLQEAYVGWFDRTRSLSLHLFEHSHGEARERGAAMARLRQLYSERGWELSVAELPDYLPVVCEFLSLAPAELQHALLSEARPVLEELHGRMLEKACPYSAAIAPLIGGTRTVPGLELDEFDGPPTEDFETLDAAWREEPVTFSAGAAQHDRATFVPLDRLTRVANGTSSGNGAASTASER
jgi:nitrate reductase delta subunit